MRRTENSIAGLSRVLPFVSLLLLTLAMLPSAAVAQNMEADFDPAP